MNTRLITARIRKFIIFCHRWMGVALCLLFALWFTSGIIMMYWSFPGVTASDRLERAAALDLSTIRHSPADAIATSGLQGTGAQMRLNTFDGRPAYRVSRMGREEKIVYADTGERQTAVSPQMLSRIASAWTGQPESAALMKSIDEVDQWTVQGALRNLRPLFKYSWPNGEQVYVSGITGEVVQYTTSASRLWAYLGAIPHWLYFTPLRKYQRQWSELVIWSSGAGTIAAILGIIIGIWMYSPAKRYRIAGAPAGFPYRGQQRWHAILGLIFGLAAVTWAFSGLLSMDPFPVQSGGPVGVPPALRRRFQMAAFADKSPREALTQVANLRVKELELTSLAGEPVYLATLARGDTRIIPVHGQPADGFDAGRLIGIVRTSGADNLAELRVLDHYDVYYLDRRHERPLPVILARMNDADHTRYYIDPKTARVVGTYSSRRWMARWLYHGLHSLDFPLLYRYRPLWDIVVISFMAGGTALCVTSLILAWRVLRRTCGALVGQAFSPAACGASRKADS